MSSAKGKGKAAAVPEEAPVAAKKAFSAAQKRYKKTNGFDKGGCHKPVKTQSFKKLLCLKVSGQSKLEFESARLRGRQSVRLSGRLSDGLRG